MDDKPLFSAVIPTYNRKDELIRLLRSIIVSDYPKDKLEIIIIDDHSSVNYGEILKEFPSIKLIRNEKEMLLAESRNIGVRNSRGKYIFLVDDDNVVDKSCIKILVDFMENNPSVGVVAPIMQYYEDRNRIWCAGIKRNYYTSVTKYIERDETDNGQYSQPIESEDFPNAFIVRREIFGKVGYFNSKDFPIHYDEADFCKRASRASYKIYCVPKAKIWHDIPLKEEVEDKARLFHCHNEFRAYYCGRNRIIFHRKYSNKWQFLIFIAIFNWLFTFYYLKVILFESKKPFIERLKIAKGYLKGVLEGLKWMNFLTI